MGTQLAVDNVIRDASTFEPQCQNAMGTVARKIKFTGDNDPVSCMKNRGEAMSESSQNTAFTKHCGPTEQSAVRRSIASTPCASDEIGPHSSMMTPLEKEVALDFRTTADIDKHATKVRDASVHPVIQGLTLSGNTEFAVQFVDRVWETRNRTGSTFPRLLTLRCRLPGVPWSTLVKLLHMCASSLEELYITHPVSIVTSAASHPTSPPLLPSLRVFLCHIVSHPGEKAPDPLLVAMGMMPLVKNKHPTRGYLYRALDLVVVWTGPLLNLNHRLSGVRAARLYIHGTTGTVMPTPTAIHSAHAHGPMLDWTVLKNVHELVVDLRGVVSWVTDSKIVQTWIVNGVPQQHWFRLFANTRERGGETLCCTAKRGNEVYIETVKKDQKAENDEFWHKAMQEWSQSRT